MKKAFSILVITCNSLYLIWYFILPYVLGAQIDEHCLQKIDTEAITNFYADRNQQNSYDEEDYWEAEGFWEVTEVKEDEDYIAGFFRTIYSESADVNVWFKIYSADKYSSKGTVKKSWGTLKEYGNFNTYTVIGKDNIQIIVDERTVSMRSDKSRQVLEKILELIGE